MFSSNIKHELVQNILNSPDTDGIPPYIDRNLPNNNDSGNSIRTKVITDNILPATPQTRSRQSSVTNKVI